MRFQENSHYDAFASKIGTCLTARMMRKPRDPDVWRKAFRAYLDAHPDLTATRWAAKADLPESSLRNFMNGGRSQTMTLASIEALAAAEGMGIDELGNWSGITVPVNQKRKQTETPRLDYDNFIRVREVDVRSSAGGGAMHDAEEDGGVWGFPVSFVESVLRVAPQDIRVITNIGDSMVSDPPKARDILPGDKLIIHTSDRIPSPGGIFIVYDGLGLVTKRLEHIPDSDPATVRIMSNNPAYTTYERTLEEAHIIGRVIGRVQRF